MRLDVYHHFDDNKDLLTQILEKLNTMETKIMALLDDVVTKVTELDTVEDSVVALLTDIKAKRDAAGTDQTKLAALSAEIDRQKQKLADAVTANTPSA